MPKPWCYFKILQLQLALSFVQMEDTTGYLLRMALNRFYYHRVKAITILFYNLQPTTATDEIF